MDAEARTSKSSGKRDACDRCHAGKSQCKKSAGTTTCDRCRRLDVGCTYSAPQNMGRPRRSTVSDRSSRSKAPAANRARQQSPAAQRKGNAPTTPPTCQQLAPPPPDTDQYHQISNFCDEERQGNHPNNAHDAFSPSATITSNALEDTLHQNAFTFADWGAPYTSPPMESTIDVDSLRFPNEDTTISYPDDVLPETTGDQSVYQSHIAHAVSTAHRPMLQQPSTSSPFFTTSTHGVETSMKQRGSPPDNSNFLNDWSQMTPESINASSYSEQNRVPSSIDRYEKCIELLSRLHLDLNKLVRQAAQDCAYERSFENTRDLPGIDSILTATRTLVEIVQSVFVDSPASSTGPANSEIPLTSPIQRDHLFNDPASFIRAGSLPTPVNIGNSNQLPDPRPDGVLILLSLSCYLRLLHIYQPLVTSLYQNLLRSVGDLPPLPASISASSSNHHNTPPAQAQSSESRPLSFTFGSFRMESSALSIQLLLYLITQLLEKIHGTIRVCFPPKDDGVFSPTGCSWNPNYQKQGSCRERPEHSMAEAAETALNEVLERKMCIMGLLRAARS
ncbi:hypothetical protein BKA65DRAFT_167522 [Rhexocercosporidium sp. MPI-PUGE-AT-0058]|nr:hypothetical protein BKA65DRAFT_167522 [Rhexocercosporidium sp. MPI-PUGE-AT-0058]